MRRLILAIFFICSAAWSCTAGFLEPIPAQWTWPPAERTTDPIDEATLLPVVLVSAARFEVGIADDLKMDQLRGLATEVFPAILDDDVPIPRPRFEMKVPEVPIEEVCETLATAAEEHELPVPFFIRLIWQESRFDPRAISPMGAQGVAQFMPATAAAMGLKNPFDPLEALQHSARLLRELIGQFGNLGLAAAAYNAGPKRILDWLAKRSKLPEETRDYVMSITGHAAERWRVTQPGRLVLDVPKRAPCKDAAEFTELVEVPAPLPPIVKKPARARLLAKRKGKEQEKEKAVASSRKKRPAELSAARKSAKVRTSEKPAPLVKRASEARKRAHLRPTKSAATGPLKITR